MSSATVEDLRWLDAAVRFAAPHLGTTADNPAVGALVVDATSGTLISRAVTAKGGRPHAEALALEGAGFEAAGQTLYVTLEPCHHWGRTPPCVDAVVRSGVMRVVVGTGDPDPRTAGESIRQLESAGIEVILADHAPSHAHHAGHVHRHTDQRPFVTAILGEDEAANAWRDMQRARADAILIDAGSARNGADPIIAIDGLARRTPLRVVLSGVTGADRSLNLIANFSGHRTAVVAEKSAPVTVPASVEVIRVSGKHGRPDLAETLALLAQRGMQNVLVESGPRLVENLLEAGLLDRLALAGDAPPKAVLSPDWSELDPAGIVRLFERTP